MKKKQEQQQDKFWTIVSMPTRLTAKLSALGILFLLLYVRLFDVFTKADIVTIPTDAYLAISLVIVVYIWIVESIDSQKYLFSQNELISLRRRLRDEQINTISTLILSQEAKDSYTQGHTERVTKYAMFLARKLGLPQEKIAVLRRAARLHDIGKIGVTDLLLSKVAKLNDAEIKIIHQHALLGDSILEPLEFLKNERILVCQHHEHYDGSGYPYGLKGDDILPGARILAISDFYDAVSSDRPYRIALKESEIIVELKKNRGRQFDPQLADLLLELIEKEKSALRQIAESAR